MFFVDGFLFYCTLLNNVIVIMNATLPNLSFTMRQTEFDCDVWNEI